MIHTVAAELKKRAASTGQHPKISVGTGGHMQDLIAIKTGPDELAWGHGGAAAKPREPQPASPRGASPRSSSGKKRKLEEAVLAGEEEAQAAAEPAVEDRQPGRRIAFSRDDSAAATPKGKKARGPKRKQGNTIPADKEEIGVNSEPDASSNPMDREEGTKPAKPVPPTPSQPGSATAQLEIMHASIAH